MATVVNNPAPASEGGSGSGFLIGVILLIAFAIIVIFYGLPYLTNSMGNAGAGTGAAAPQVQVPDKIDVNVKQQP